MKKETSYTLLLHFYGDLIKTFNFLLIFKKTNQSPSAHLVSFAEISKLSFPFQLQKHITLKFHCTTKPSSAK